jgi:hypothetical protein
MSQVLDRLLSGAFVFGTFFGIGTAVKFYYEREIVLGNLRRDEEYFEKFLKECEKENSILPKNKSIV